MTSTMATPIIRSHPKGVAFIAFTQMWESFSFFGMRALLVLYLVSQGGFNYKDAVVLYTLYIALVKIFGSIGGYAVDRFLGYKRSILIGGTLIVIGHLLLTFSSTQPLFFLSLGSIVCGSALFRISLQAFLGLFYEKEDPRRDKGFTLLYVGMNLGGLAAAILCGFIAETYGWHAGFGLAAFGMVIGMGIFLSKISLFNTVEQAQTTSMLKVLPFCLLGALSLSLLFCFFTVVQPYTLPLGCAALIYVLYSLGKKINKSLLLSLTGAVILLIIFCTAEELWGTLLMIFSESHVDRTILGIEIPSSAIAATNPLTIIMLGSFIGKRKLSLRAKLALAFLSLALAFFTLYMAAVIPKPCALYLMAGLAFIAIGELLLAPSLLAFASKIAPKSSAGMIMGVTTLAFSMGSLLSGEIAKVSLKPQATFLVIGLSAFGLFILLWRGKYSRFFQQKTIS